MLSDIFGQGFNSIDESLNWGFKNLEKAAQDQNISIEHLNADFNYSLGLVIEQLETTNYLLNNLLDKLDNIHKTLENPILTQSREYYRLGCERLSRGLLDKALESFIKAEEKNDVDFFTQYHMGKLYLYGIDDDDDVVDFMKAEKHLLDAARYAKSEISIDATFSKLAAEALFHAAIAIYAQMGEPSMVVDESLFNKLLTKAIQILSEAVRLNPQLGEALYHMAKFTAILGDADTSLNYLEKAIRLDSKYAIKIDIDHTFDPIREHTYSLMTKLRDSQESIVLLDIKNVHTLMNEFRALHPEDSGSLNNNFNNTTKDFDRIKHLYSTKTFIGLLEASTICYKLIELLPKLIVERKLEIEKQKLVQELKKKIEYVRSQAVSVGITDFQEFDRDYEEIKSLHLTNNYSSLTTAEIKGINLLKNSITNWMEDKKNSISIMSYEVINIKKNKTIIGKIFAHNKGCLGFFIIPSLIAAIVTVITKEYSGILTFSIQITIYFLMIVISLTQFIMNINKANVKEKNISSKKIELEHLSEVLISLNEGGV